MSDTRSAYGNGMTQGLMPFRGQIVSEQNSSHDATLSVWKERMCYGSDDAYVAMCEARSKWRGEKDPDAE